VLSSNLFMSYFLLEMLTLSTYLLVGFWYAQPLVVTAARDAFLTKRVGDVLLLMALVALSCWAGSLEFSDLYRWIDTAQLAPLPATLLGLGLIAGPMGKCAQFPMHLWLDEAMEGPNPASILRNSAVVTCGALVLLKLMPLLSLSPVAIQVLLVVGTISALGGALVAIAQVDLKRTFSYGTTSYLGLVFLAIALQKPLLALLLLFAHGLAKALARHIAVNPVVREDARQIGDIRQARHVLERQRVIREQAGDHQRQGRVLGARDRDDAIQSVAADNADAVHVSLSSAGRRFPWAKTWARCRLMGVVSGRTVLGIGP
jgi:formate hydrogenlyase subunit 3/multisubunit Na+/H+ antiporter MnhD subunit